MVDTISNARVAGVLRGLHAEASNEMGKILQGLSKGVFRKLRPEDMGDTYIAISRAQGESIYRKIIERKAKYIVEFGTSFGISTLYLGAAARLTQGQVITTELLEHKCRVARNNFLEAGLDDIIELRQGDAMETLRDLENPIDFLLLDGWNDLYLPLLQQLEPTLRPGALIYTDNASMKSARPFLDYVRRSPYYHSESDGLGGEITEFVGKS